MVENGAVLNHSRRQNEIQKYQQFWLMESNRMKGEKQKDEKSGYC